MPVLDEDYWYHHRDELAPGQVFLCHDGSAVRLDHRVPGDGTDWIVEDNYNGHWIADERRIHPGDLRDRSTVS